MKLTRAEFPMCPTCGAEMRRQLMTCAPAHQPVEYRCNACAQNITHPDWGYHADLDAVREVIREMGAGAVHLLDPPAPRAITDWKQRLERAIGGEG